MKTKKKSLLCLIILVLFPLVSIHSILGAPDYVFTEPQEIDKGAPIFYLFSMNKSESIQIQIISQNSGNYSLFLFDTRPIQTYVNPDGSLNPIIFNISTAKNITVNPFLKYTTPSTSDVKLYYIEVILLNETSDLFYISSTKKLSRYYIPQIPGFPFYLIIGVLFGSFGLLSLIIVRKKLLYIY